MIRRISIAVMLVIAMGIAQGCGGTNDDPVQKYKQQVNTEFANFGQQIAPIAGTITAQSPHSSDVTVMHNVASDLHQLAGRIGALKVPKGSLKPLNTQLQQEINNYADAIANAAGQDPTGFKNEQRLFSSNMASTIQSINNQN